MLLRVMPPARRTSGTATWLAAVRELLAESAGGGVPLWGDPWPQVSE
jgi:hypothetical protein